MPSNGIDRHTGKLLTGWPHVVQSIEDIITTRVLSRVMRRDYGSDVPRLVDSPMNQATLLKLYNAVAEALDAWEPRFRLLSVLFVAASNEGRAHLALAGIYYPRGHLGDYTPASEPTNTSAIVQLSEGL